MSIDADEAPPPRVVRHHYTDPIDLIWLHCAAEIGLRVVRSDDAWVSFDGDRTLLIATPERLDPDDQLGQLVLHELCHALVGGPGARRRPDLRPDWGLENVDARDLVYEHACHRLQAALADLHGLREFMAVTTDWRPYWDALPADPMAGSPFDPDLDPAIPLAREAWEQATTGPWAAPLAEALERTARVAQVVLSLGRDGELWRLARAAHPCGGLLGDSAERRCGDCAWAFDAGGAHRCRRHGAPLLDPTQVGCLSWEARLSVDDCFECGACCRQAYGLVEVRGDDVIGRTRPGWVVRDDLGRHLPRPGGFCVALASTDAPWRCSVYDDRPASCREFALAGDACLDARRRLKLTR